MHHRRGWGPGVGHGPARRARRGDVREAILVLLAEEPRNGYGLMQEIEERSGGVWRPSPGSIYPALQQLEDEGLVRSSESGGRRTYELTDDGRAAVAGRAADRPAPWAAAGASVDEQVVELFAVLRQVGTAVGQLSQVATEAELAAAREILAETRRALYRLLAEDDRQA
jgi:DNA-binding PadR family transcriptional regulator